MFGPILQLSVFWNNGNKAHKYFTSYSQLRVSDENDKTILNSGNKTILCVQISLFYSRNESFFSTLDLMKASDGVQIEVSIVWTYHGII